MSEQLRADGEWHVPVDWENPVLVIVGDTAATAAYPVALFRYADQADVWASNKDNYPGRYRLLALNAVAAPHQE